MLFTALGPFLTSLMISIISIPVIIRVAALKHLMDEPDEERKFHSIRTPTLGGIAIFAGTLFAFSSFSDYVHASKISFMIPALVLLFFAGVKDDILILSPVKKLFVQAICSALITIFGNIRLSSLWGMFGITEISPLLGTLLTFVMIVGFINAFNLIDGVNGLASGLGFIACILFGTWFQETGAQTYAILAFSLAGALLGFLYFNFGHAKIFMGDTGSMIIGFIVSILAIKFIENNRLPGVENSLLYVKAAPGVALSVVIIPLFDMTRVFFYRIKKGRSPFSADRNHLHHYLLDMDLSHIQVSIIFYLLELSLITLSFFLKEMRSLELTVVILIAMTLFTTIVIWLKKRGSLKKNTNKIPHLKNSTFG